MARLIEYPPVRPNDTNFQRTVAVGKVLQVRKPFLIWIWQMSPLTKIIHRLVPGDKLIISKVGISTHGSSWSIEDFDRYGSPYCVSIKGLEHWQHPDAPGYNGDWLALAESMIYDCRECE